MKWIKIKDKLPNKEGVYHTKQSTGFTTYNGIDYFNGNAFVRSGDYEVIEWLDESEEEITDSMRLDWLENAVINSSNLSFRIGNKYGHLAESNTLREFIDKQLKQE